MRSQDFNHNAGNFSFILPACLKTLRTLVPAVQPDWCSCRTNKQVHVQSKHAPSSYGFTRLRYPPFIPSTGTQSGCWRKHWLHARASGCIAAEERLCAEGRPSCITQATSANAIAINHATAVLWSIAIICWRQTYSYDFARCPADS